MGNYVGRRLSGNVASADLLLVYSEALGERTGRWVNKGLKLYR